MRKHRCARRYIAVTFGCRGIPWRPLASAEKHLNAEEKRTAAPSIDDRWQGYTIVTARGEWGNISYLVDTHSFEFVPLVKDYIDHLVARAGGMISTNTTRAYCYSLRYLYTYLRLKGLSPLTLQYEDLVSFRLWLKAPLRHRGSVIILHDWTPLDDATVDLIIDGVSAFFRWMANTGRIADNPVRYRSVIKYGARDHDLLAHVRRGNTVQKNLLKGRTPHKKPRVISAKDFDTLLNAQRSVRNTCILLILKEGGLREGELLGLKLEDFDYCEEGIWVRFRADNPNGARAKAGYGRDRFVDLPRDLLHLVDRYICSERLDADPDNDYLFVTLRPLGTAGAGTPLDRDALISVFRYWNRKLSLHVMPHALRHTHATDLVRNYISEGEPINWDFISKRLGHANVMTTIRTYVHLTAEDYRRELRRLKREV